MAETCIPYIAIKVIKTYTYQIEGNCYQFSSKFIYFIFCPDEYTRQLQLITAFNYKHNFDLYSLCSFSLLCIFLGKQP